jgi:hypothetical protein
MAKAGPEALKAGGDKARQEKIAREALMKRQATQAHFDAEAKANRMFSQRGTKEMREALEEARVHRMPSPARLRRTLF